MPVTDAELIASAAMLDRVRTKAAWELLDGNNAPEATAIVRARFADDEQVPATVMNARVAEDITARSERAKRDLRRRPAIPWRTHPRRDVVITGPHMGAHTFPPRLELNGNVLGLRGCPALQTSLNREQLKVSGQL